MMIGKFKIQPLWDWVLIKVDVEEEKSKDEIIIFDATSNNQKSQKGIILAIGNGKKDKSMILKAGDFVLFIMDSGIEFSLKGDTMFFIKESNIFGVIQPVNLEVI